MQLNIVLVLYFDIHGFFGMTEFFHLYFMDWRLASGDIIMFHHY
jgi:hypothetical protein